MRNVFSRFALVVSSALCITLLLGGCAKDEGFEQSGSQTEESEDACVSRVGGRGAGEAAVYHEQTESWVRHQADPYTLRNFQQAYDNLAAGKSVQQFQNAAVRREFMTRRRLSPTHYSLKIFPRNEDEQEMVEMMQDVKTAYVPFDYVALTQEENEALNASGRLRTSSAALPDERRYTVTYTDMQTIEGPAPDETITMPVLYVVWPVEKPLPAELDYEIASELFHPQSLRTKIISPSLGRDPDLRNDAGGGGSGAGSGGSGMGTEEGEDAGAGGSSTGAEDVTAGGAADEGAEGGAAAGDVSVGGIGTTIMSDEALGLLQGEAIAIAIGDLTDLKYEWIRSVKLIVRQNDSEQGVVPMANLRVVFRLGSSFWYHNTDSDGGLRVSISKSGDNNIPWDATMETVFYSHGRWKITSGGANPIAISYGRIFDFWSSGSERRITYATTLAEATIHRAVNYFYNGTHYVPKEIMGNGIKIIASYETDSKKSASFKWNLLRDEYIKVFNNSPNNNSLTIGSTLHEFGHMAQYNRNTALGFGCTKNILLESWASYVGWHVGEAYYISIGWEKPGDTILSDITGQARQTWVSKNDDYSPLFIDLIDGYNQCTAKNPNRPTDRIKITDPVVHRHILHVADNFKYLDSCKDYFKKNLPCNQGDLLTYLWPYRNSQ